MPQHLAPGKRPGFRLVDLLVALLLIILLGGVLTVSASRVRGLADRKRSENNLKQLALAFQACVDTNQGKVPTGRANFYPSDRLVPNTGYGPCLFHMLPYLEQQNVYKTSLVQLGDTPIYASWQSAGTVIKTFVGPGDPTADPPSDRTSYLANGLAMPRFSARFPASFSDGTSYTILFAESYSRAVGSQGEAVERRWWDDPSWTATLTGVTFQLAPAAQAASARLPQGFAADGLQVIMADAAIHLVKPGCSSKTFYEACTPNGGEPLGSDW
jgi:type II secretory pathway pseudopilin PulG